MSVNHRLQRATLYAKTEEETLSGAKKATWVPQRERVYMSVYYASEFSTKEPFRHKDISHVALSTKLPVARELRALVGGKGYDIMTINPNGRRFLLTLREVEKW